MNLQYSSGGGDEKSERGWGRPALSFVATQALILHSLLMRQQYVLVGLRVQKQQATTTKTTRRGLERTGRTVQTVVTPHLSRTAA